MASKLTYDTRSCTRCGGSGTYSYCSMYGTTCFKCRGAKTVLTPAGAKASARVAEFIKAHFSVKVDDLKPGDRIRYEGKIAVVKEATLRPEPAYNQTYVDITPANVVKTRFGPLGQVSMVAGDMIVKAVTGADWDRVVEFARTIKKGVSAVEPPTPAEPA